MSPLSRRRRRDGYIFAGVTPVSAVCVVMMSILCSVYTGGVYTEPPLGLFFFLFSPDVGA